MLSNHQTIANAFAIISKSIAFMSWNTFLALLPLLLATIIFSNSRKKVLIISLAAAIAFIPRAAVVTLAAKALCASLTPVHWLIFCCLAAAFIYGSIFSSHKKRVRLAAGLVLFYLFLPNAPYVLTDVVHLMETIRAYQSHILLTVFVIPIYALFMLIGFGAYVLSLMELISFIRAGRFARFATLIEYATHFLSAVGIYLGRFLRFNSWDVATNPDTIIAQSLNTLSSRNAIIVIGISFIIVAALYQVARIVITALRTHRQHLAEQSMIMVNTQPELNTSKA